MTTHAESFCDPPFGMATFLLPYLTPGNIVTLPISNMKDGQKILHTRHTDTKYQRKQKKQEIT